MTDSPLFSKAAKYPLKGEPVPGIPCVTRAGRLEIPPDVRIPADVLVIFSFRDVNDYFHVT